MEAGTQFIGIKPEINMQERKSNVANNPTDVFTIEDIAEAVQGLAPYKVYTALLTQSGGNDFGNLTSGDLTIGVTYFIQLLEGADFSNVGGSNIEGEYFIATGTTPNSWGTGGQLEYNNGSPVATVLENTIGNVYWIYEGTGQYSASVPNFVQEKVLIFYGAGTAGATTYVVQAYVNNFPPFGVWIDTSDSITGLSADDVLQETPIEIRVYN
jgi:hypothetical protein